MAVKSKKATKKPAAKKKTVKKTAVKKARPGKSVKKAAVKKKAVKKIAVKKSAVKRSTKIAVKKKAVKKTAVKKIATKRPIKKVAPKKAGKKAVTKTVVRSAAIKKKAAAPVVISKKPWLKNPEKLKLPPVINIAEVLTAEQPVQHAVIPEPAIIPLEVLIDQFIKNDEPVRTFDRRFYSKATAKGDPRSKLQLSNKSKRAKMPSSKKPLWRK